MTGTAQQQKKTLLMTEGSIWKSILLFSVPLILGNMLQQLYNTADSIIVGNFVGSNALAAVAPALAHLPAHRVQPGIAVGAGVVVSQFLGAKDREGAHTAVHTSLALSAILGAILTVCGIAVSRALLTAMNTPAEVLEDAVLYIRLYFGGVLFSVVYNMAAGILNAAGNSKRSLLYLACLHHQHRPRPCSDRRMQDGRGRCGHCHRYQPAGVLCALPALSDAGGGRLPRDGKGSARAQKDGGPHHQGGPATGIQNMVISLSNVLVQVSVNGYGAAAWQALPPI